LTGGVPTWVVGAGGLLGGAVVRALREAGTPALTSVVPWTDAPGSVAALSRDIDTLLRAAGDGPWRIAWCAGAGVLGSTQEKFDTEVATMDRFFDLLATRSRSAGPGRVFVASSAGALYAGAADPPFTERSVVAPLAPYGRAKLAGERLATAFADRAGADVVIGRISNLYGPGQDMTKGQGLISHLCRSQLQRRPVSLFVSLDTLRDYLYVDDCAAMVATLLTRPMDPGTRVVTKILAAQQDTTISTLLAEMRRLFKRPVQVVLGSSPNARAQARDLRLRSRVWPDVDHRARTPLPVGIARTAQALRADLVLTR
jgi:UDP-glucose 4-epimerase